MAVNSRGSARTVISGMTARQDFSTMARISGGGGEGVSAISTSPHVGRKDAEKGNNVEKKQEATINYILQISAEAVGNRKILGFSPKKSTRNHLYSGPTSNGVLHWRSTTLTSKKSRRKVSV